MKGYQRFIAYVYEYRQGRKENNCGFIKVEEKNHLFKMEVHLKCQGLSPKLECKIYGFIRERGLMRGVLLGTAVTGEGIVEYAMECDGRNMGDMGIDWHDFGGMILKIENEIFWGTEWDDKRIRPEYFEELKREIMPDRQEQSQAVQQEPEELKEVLKEAVQESTEGNAEESQETKVGLEVGLEVEPAEEPETESETLKEIISQPKAEELEQELIRMYTKAEKEDANLLSEELKQSEQELRTEPGTESETIIEPEISSGQKSKAEEEKINAQEVSWEQKESCFSGDDEIVTCRKIHPKDLRFLHPRDAALRNNRFLMNGYCRFGYLLLGKKENGQYILGVPGGYDQQERFMASMFGFPYFKENSCMCQPEHGRGYWYRLIHTPNFHCRDCI